MDIPSVWYLAAAAGAYGVWRLYRAWRQRWRTGLIGSYGGLYPGSNQESLQQEINALCGLSLYHPENRFDAAGPFLSGGPRNDQNEGYETAGGWSRAEVAAKSVRDRSYRRATK